MKNIFLLACLSLLGCASSSKILSNSKNLSNDPSFSLTSPIDMQYRFERSDASTAFGNYDFTLRDRRSENDTTVHIYPPRSRKKCSPLTIGVGTLKEQAGDFFAFWGRSDLWDGRGQEGWEFPQNWESIVCKKEGSPMPKEVYGFCAEKNGKTVVICLNLMKDNPQLAEEIFSSFQWLK